MICVAACFLALSLNPTSADTIDSVTDWFIEANRAYDEGRFAEAVSMYERIREHGYLSEALLFNLGNAYYRTGRPGKAILHYKRASYLNPRNPDIGYNIRFVTQTTGALPVEHNFLQRMARGLTAAEWIGIGVASYWLAFLGLGLACVLSRGRSFLRRLALLFALLWIPAGLGAGHWLSLSLRPEMVVIQSGQEALFAPIEGETAYFAAPEGTVGRQIDRRDDWIRIAVGDHRGWVKEPALAPVYPLTPKDRL